MSVLSRWFIGKKIKPPCAAGGRRNGSLPVSDHCDGLRFFNPWHPEIKTLRDVFTWYLTRKRRPWPPYRELAVTDKPPRRVEGGRLRLSFVGHATVLLQTRGVNILLDPVWADRVGPFGLLGPHRVLPPGIRFDDVPPVDALLISHNHFDHLDLGTVRRLWRRDRPRIIVPLGSEGLICRALGEDAVWARDWGQAVSLSPELSVSLEPAQHWAARTLFDKNQALWASFVLSAPEGHCYLSGDSGYAGHFRAVREKYKTFRLAALPIGSSDPRWFMGYNHMNAEEGALASRDLGLPFTLPMHYGVFRLADTGPDEPLHNLKAAIRRHGLPEDRFHPLQPGEYCWIP